MNSESLKRVLEQRDFYRRSFIRAVLNPLFSTAFQFTHANEQLTVRVVFEIGRKPELTVSKTLNKEENRKIVGTIVVDPRIRQLKPNKQKEILVSSYLELKREFEHEIGAEPTEANVEIVSFGTLFYKVFRDQSQAKKPLSIESVIESTARFYESHNGGNEITVQDKELLEFVLYVVHSLEKPLSLSFKDQIEIDGLSHDLRVLFKKTPKRLKEVLADNLIHLDQESGKMVATIIMHPQIFQQPLWVLKDIATHEFVEIIYGFIEKENRNKSIFDKMNVISAYHKWTVVGSAIKGEPAQQQDTVEEFESVEKTKRRLLVSDESLRDVFGKHGIKFPLESLDGLEDAIIQTVKKFADEKFVDRAVVDQRISEFLKSNPGAD